MAEDSAELMKTLEENRRALQKQIGCLAGLLQIFDRHRCLTGRRFGSQRTNTTAHEDAASTVCGTDVTFHDPGSPLQTYHQYSEVSVQSSRRIEEQILSSNKEEWRLSSDFVSRAPDTRWELKSPSRTVPVANPDASVDMITRLSFDNKFCKSPESALIRTIVVNSLHKEKPRSSVDNSNREVMAGLIRLKNLARSRSVGGRNAYHCSENSKFPRSCSLSAHQSSGIYGEAPNLTMHRLTVELEDGPGVGIKKLNPSNSCFEARQAVMNLDKALGEVDLKESFRALKRERSTRRSDEEEHCVDERSCAQADGRRNVVARLMGLEEFSSPPTTRKDQTCMKARGRSLPPKHRLMDVMPSPLRQREAHCKLTKTMKMSEGGACKTPSPPLEPLYGDIIERLQQLRSRNSAEERDTLIQIMETLQLKGLLHSPQRKSRSATPQYHVRQRSKDHVASEKACHRMDNEDTGTVQIRDHHVECKPSRSECSVRSDATTATRCSNEDGGSVKPGRGRSIARSPVRTSKSPVRSASKSPVRMNNDARSTSHVSGTTVHPNTKPVRSISAAKPHSKQLQVVPGQVMTNAPHLRDKRESKVAHDPVSNANKADGAIRIHCDSAQSVKSSPEMRRQKRTTSREMQSGVSRPLSLVEKHEEKSVVDTEKPSEELAQISIQTSTNQDPCVELNTTPAKIREMLESLKDREMPTKDASELMTPRAGFQVEEISPPLEKSGQCSEASSEQRSPVSVLDNSIFDEDGSPSPVPTDSYESNDEVKAENAATSKGTESDHTSSGDNAREFVEELLKRSGLSNHVSLACFNISEINPTCLMDLKEDLQRMPFLEQGAHLNKQLHPQALMDYVYELLAFEVAEYESTAWNCGAFKSRRNLVDAIWKELQEFPSAASGDICDTVQGILIQDVGSRGPKWTDFRAEIGEVGVEVEKMIYRDLMEEVVNDLTCSGSSRYLAKLLEGPRRQLFTS